MNFLKTFAVSAALLSIAAPVAAATVSNVSGVVYEGGPRLQDDTPMTADFDLGDFSSNPNNPTLMIVGTTDIYGAVQHKNDHQYDDSWAMDFGTNIYNGVFNWANRTSLFDGQLLVNGVQYLLGNSGSYDLTGLTGFVQFRVDPIFGDHEPIETATWNLEVAPVPLPAGILLMLTAIGGLGLIRKRQTA